MTDWIAFPGAIVTPYYNCWIHFINSNGFGVNVKVRYADYAIDDLTIDPGEIIYPLSSLVVWRYLGRDKNQKKNIEETVYVEKVGGLFVFARNEHNQMWIDRKPEHDFYAWLPRFEVAGEPPFGPGEGRQGPYIGPEKSGG